MKTYISKIIALLSGLYLSLLELTAQSPTHIDTRSKDPKPFTLDDVLLYIIFPVLLFLAALWARRYQKKKREEKDNPLT